MSEKRKKWLIRGGREGLAPSIREEFGIGALAERVLVSRGITEKNAVAEALGICLPEYDPFLMKDMDRAVERIRLEIEKKGKITVFGDYDVDGLTSAYILSDWLSANGADCMVYIPEREGEGYGMSGEALARIAQGGTTLVVSVDNGINAVEQAKTAKELGMDMVVTDHHTPSEMLPECCAVVDPHRADCPYPNKALAGVGVAFKLICALENGDEASVMARYGDMLALGTVADVCEVTGENRRLLTAAEKVLKNTKNPGLRALAAKCGCPSPGLSDIGFRLAPRLNAAGRMGSASDAMRLLQSPDAAQAEANAEFLCLANSRRQSIETKIAAEAETLAAEEDLGTAHALVLRGDDWKLGVIGIVAAKLADRFGVPVILMARENDILKGSARSGGDYDIFSAMSRAGDGIASCGGHRAAAGIKLPPENFGEFKRRFLEITSAEIPSAGLTATVEADAEVEPGDISFASVAELERFAPFGQGNSQPVFCLRDMRIVQCAPMGDGRHSRLTLERDGARLGAVWFGASVQQLGYCSGDFADLVFTADINEFRGVKSVRLTVKDMCLSEERAMEQYRGLLSGGTRPENAPSREDCAAVWNELKTAWGTTTTDALLKKVCRVRSVGILPFLAILRAFEESGLTCGPEYREWSLSEKITIEPANRSGEKVQLWNTEIFKAFGKERN
ncbi:MAG: single-stranded-DNA-specific exonuclease RecJ [Eubacteriales bacterium]